MGVEYYEERLAQAKARLEAFTESKLPKDLDHGMLNISFKARGVDIHSEIDQYKKLAEAVRYWQRKLTGARVRADAPARREAKAARHAEADLKARYGDCAEVRWSLNGVWYRVERWNRKSVKVSGMSIPHDQVAGAR